MKLFLVFLVFLFSVVCFSQQDKKTNINTGRWSGSLNLNSVDVLPFRIKVLKKKSTFHFFIYNGKEKIEMDPISYVNDSLHVAFPYFNSKLVFSVNTKNYISGYWVNFNKGENYKIPFSARHVKKSCFSVFQDRSTQLSVDGKWKVEFAPKTDYSYPAIGLFSQKKNSNHLTGTFLTETGDYRFLEGQTKKDSLVLSCFDGSHAFLFKAAMVNKDSLSGRFLSGKHWETNWNAVKNQSFTLSSPEKLTYLVNGETISFGLKRLDGTLFSYPQDVSKNKVVILQIMGSWCPNCLDETLFYKTLYDKYHDKGLEIISIAYEIGENFDDYVTRVQKLKNKLSLDFTFLIGGKASKSLASQHFNGLNEIVSFPTSIFIDKQGEVVRVHTGFNGPGTGAHYTNYKRKTTMLLEYLLAQ